MHSLLDLLNNMPLSPELLKCPGSSAHVWNLDQCPRISNPPGSFPGSGGGGGGGLLGALGRVVGAIL